MDEEVSVRYIFGFEAVGVGYTDDANGIGVRGRKAGRTAEAEEEMVKWIEKSSKGGGEEIVWY